MTDEGTCTLGTVLVVGPAATHGQVSGLTGVASEVLDVEADSLSEVQATGAQPELVVIREEEGCADVLDALRVVQSCFPAVPSVVVTRNPSAETADVLADSEGTEYIEGPLEGDCLDRLLLAARPGRTASDDIARFFCPYCPPGVPVVGRSDGITAMLETLSLVAASRCNPILVLGETGTGKELVARGVHALRCRETDPFVAVNCAALTANLLESELFGHVKGAFTGADRDKTGLFEAAGRGTLFLDEISEMPLELQAKLLRALQENRCRKVGGTKDIRGHATIVASSNRDLQTESAEGRFRKDLYYRLAVFPIAVPPLRSPERRDDITLLAEHFVLNSSVSSTHTVKKLSASACERLRQHDWPGNVRELRNVIDRALIVEKTDEIQPASIILGSTQMIALVGGAPPSAEQEFSLEAAERQFILRALTETGWQRTRAAALLGITRATLHAKLKRYGITRPDKGLTRVGAVGQAAAGN